MSDAVLTFGSTILGAAIAALFAWLMARRTSRETLARDTAQRLETKLGLALQAYVKLKTVVDNQWSVLQLLEEALANTPNAKTRPWQSVTSPVAHSSEFLVEFTAAELALFIEAQRTDLADHMQMLARRNATIWTVFERYGEGRRALEAKLPPTEVLEDGKRVLRFTDEQSAACEPQMANLDSLIEQLVSRLREDVDLGAWVSSEVGPALRQHFGDERFPGFVVASPDEDAVPAAYCLQFESGH